METLEQCPVCGSNTWKTLFSCKDYVASAESFTIVSCTACTHQFTQPRPAEDEIGRYYQSDKYISHTGNQKSELGVTYKIYDWVRNYSIGSKLRTIKKFHVSGKLLDLGCGLGYFFHGVKQDNTFEADAADVSDEAIEYIHKNFGYAVMNESHMDQLTENSYDIITQWHVLEHVHRIDERMSLLKKILKPGGTMFIAVPNAASFDAKFYKAYWDGYDVPRHIHHFTPNSFEKLMNNYGFKIVKKKAMLFDAPYISMRSEYHQKHILGFFRGAFWGAISTLAALFTGNYSSVMFIVKHK